MANRVASFCLTLSKMSNDALAKVSADAWAVKLRLAPGYVASLIAAEVERRG